MNMFLTTFVTIFLAELGDKTQLATLLFAANKEYSKLTIFLGAALALVATSAIGVLVGAVVGNYVPEKVLKILAGTGFIAVGIWTLVK
jgi:putative Ca2+/H+ antiporter (TMEM165/GDT1 family)